MVLLLSLHKEPVGKLFIPVIERVLRYSTGFIERYVYMHTCWSCTFIYGTASADKADTAHVSLEAPGGFNLDNRTLSVPLCVRIPRVQEYNKRRKRAVWDTCTSSTHHY